MGQSLGTSRLSKCKYIEKCDKQNIRDTNNILKKRLVKPWLYFVPELCVNHMTENNTFCNTNIIC